MGFQDHSLFFIFFTSLFSQREQTLQSSFLGCLSRTDIFLQLSTLSVHQKKTTAQFFILLNCCLYIYILNSSFNTSCTNFFTFISFFFYNSTIYYLQRKGERLGHRPPFQEISKITYALGCSPQRFSFAPENILKYHSCSTFSFNWTFVLIK